MTVDEYFLKMLNQPLDVTIPPTDIFSHCGRACKATIDAAAQLHDCVNEATGDDFVQLKISVIAAARITCGILING